MDMVDRIICNQYKIARKIGQGGMGIVYLATDLHLGRDVAIKMIQPSLLDDPDLVARFRREAKALGRLNHPNITTLYNLVNEDDNYCMVMEFIDGIGLDKMLRNRGPIPTNEAVSIIIQALKGIVHAHQNNVLHRDLKPSNLMVTPDGTVKIMDFGIARLMDSSTLHTALTSGLTGTVQYMAPELIDGRPATPASDLYALCLVLYQLLAGKAPFHSTTLSQLLNQILHQQPDYLESISPQLNALLSQMLDKNPDKRLVDAHQLIEALTPFTINQPALTTIPPVISEQPTGGADVRPILADALTNMEKSKPALPNAPVPDEKRREKRRLVWLLLLLLLLIMVGGGFYFFNAKKTNLASIEQQPDQRTLYKPSEGVVANGPKQENAGSNTNTTNSISRVYLKPVDDRASRRPHKEIGNLRPKPIANKPVDPLSNVTPLPMDSPQTASFPNTGSQLVTVVSDVEKPTVSETTPAPVERTERKNTEPKVRSTISRKTIVALTPEQELSADQLQTGATVRFRVDQDIVAESNRVVIRKGALASAKVSEVKAVNGLDRSYIILKNMKVETADNQEISLEPNGPDSEIGYYGDRNRNAVIKPQTMRPVRAFTTDL